MDRKEYFKQYAAEHREDKKKATNRWRIDNRQRYLDAQKEYKRNLSPEKKKQYTETWLNNNPTYIRDWQRAKPEFVLCRNARQRAEKYGYDFALTEDMISIPEYCHICGTQMKQNDGKGPRTDSPTIDRIETYKGYTPDNIHIVCFGCNARKSTKSIYELSFRLDALGDWAKNWLSEHPETIQRMKELFEIVYRERFNIRMAQIERGRVKARARYWTKKEKV